MGHTQEPWELHAGLAGSIFYKEQCVARCCEPMSEANARRIVVCVNACAGIPDEVLFTIGAFGGFGRDDMVQHLRAQLAAVTAQRDKLVEALEKIADNSYESESASIAMQALADVKGGAA